jgi:23S rRNA (cytidine1920-2'-O)/16S rRNA (cytidine1409-2'-O)-methyltransferase
VTKIRADALLVERGLAPSRSRAQALIMAGEVMSGERRVEKAGERLTADAPLRLKEQPRYVSRGGDKLAHALQAFAPEGLVVAGRTCLDVGASTGGFTDCLLQHGATRVYAVDVGFGQLHEKLRADPRVVVRERTNARHLAGDDFPEPIDLAVVDASFISLGKLAPALAATLRDGGELVALIKPQFEAGRRAAAAGRGVIRDEKVRQEAIEAALTDLQASGFALIAGVDSPIRGPKGNLEHLIYARH